MQHLILYILHIPVKTAFVTLKGGTKWEGGIKDVDRKKERIDELKLVVDSKKKKFATDEISDFFMAPSGFDQFNK